MSQIPKEDDLPSLLYPSLRDKRSSGPQIVSKFIKLRSRLRSPTHVALNLFNNDLSQKKAPRTSSLPNVAQLDICPYDNEDESEIASFIRPTFRYSHLALPPRHMFQKPCTDPPAIHDNEDDNKSLVSTCSTWSTNDSSDDEDTTVTLCRPATAILVSLPLSSAAAASVARSRRIRSTRAHSSPAMMRHFD